MEAEAICVEAEAIGVEAEAEAIDEIAASTSLVVGGATSQNNGFKTGSKWAATFSLV